MDDHDGTPCNPHKRTIEWFEAQDQVREVVYG
jgi:hypothetical protein